MIGFPLKSAPMFSCIFLSLITWIGEDRACDNNTRCSKLPFGFFFISLFSILLVSESIYNLIRNSKSLHSSFSCSFSSPNIQLVMSAYSASFSFILVILFWIFSFADLYALFRLFLKFGSSAVVKSEYLVSYENF